MAVHVKIADRQDEFDRIFRLNYETFVEEIPQHARNPERMLVDKYHAENLYLICLEDDELMGMVALRDRRPFSLDAKLPNLDAFLPKGARALEIRLLAVKPHKRHSLVFGLLMKALLARCMEMDYDVGLISGRIENIPLYEKVGFRPFGPRVGGPGAWYQPMRIDRDTLNRGLGVLPKAAAAPDPSAAPSLAAVPGRTLNFLPGPVAHSCAVLEALAAPALSHRAERYAAMLGRTKAMLLQTTRSGGVEILAGTGTLANDVIAGQLSLRPGRGLVISNGEFGERLIRHAEGFRLAYAVHSEEWGCGIDLNAVEKTLRAHPDIRWVWAVHCETSTGRINPLPELRGLCDRYAASLCLDCISSLGVTPVDLSGIDLASGVSGKGLGALTGLALVFHLVAPAPAPMRLPRSLDLGLYAASEGTPFSGSSNLLASLEASLSERLERSGSAFRDRIAASSAYLRECLEAAGIPVLLDADASSPAILTLPLPSSSDSLEMGARMELMGILLNYRGGYLTDRNWIQIALMADHSREDLRTLVSALEEVCAERFTASVLPR